MSELHSRARWKKLNLVLPVLPDLLEGHLHRLLHLLVELLPVDGAGDGDDFSAGVGFFQLLYDLGDEVVQDEADTSFRLPWSHERFVHHTVDAGNPDDLGLRGHDLVQKEALGGALLEVKLLFSDHCLVL